MGLTDRRKTAKHFKSHHPIENLVYLYTSDTFRPILALSHILLYTTFFNMYITTRNTFLIPDDAVIGESSGFNFYFQFQQSKASVELYFTF